MDQELEALLQKYDTLDLECDGLTRIISHVLKNNEVPHQCYIGGVTFCEKTMPTHFWITWQDKIIDFRLRMWFNSMIPLVRCYWVREKAPHGIFTKPDNLRYDGVKLDLPCSSVVFDVLTRDLQ